MVDQDAEKKTFRMPTWVRDFGMKILPWAMMAVIGASASLYTDNIGNKRDIAREAWRNDGQDARHNRFEANQDKIRESVTDLRDDQNNFKQEVREEIIKRLDLLLEKRNKGGR